MMSSLTTSAVRNSLSPDRSWESISIIVSDEESDESSAKMKFKLKKKRRKDRRTGNIYSLAIRKLSRWWFCLFLVPVFVLLFSEISKSWKTEITETSVIENHQLKPTSNLNRLDMPTRSVNGVRQPCLKLLPTEDIERLEFPTRQFSHYPVKSLFYAASDTSQDSKANVMTSKHLEVANVNFNFFTGNQTLQQRFDSFKLQETMTVHCGFHDKRGGFDIDLQDKMFMNKCIAVISTCTFGGGDDLFQPIGMVEASLKKVCYVAFWDNITLQERANEGKKLDEDHKIGLWRVVLVHNLPFTDQRLNGKIPKMLAHRLFPHAKYSIWVDSKSQFRRDPMAVFETLLWRTNSALAISEHGARSCVYDEGIAIVRKHKATPDEVERQLTQYRLDGFPPDPRFDGHKALAEASVIVREHTSMTNLFMCLWFNEVVRFTSRDQLSFPYVLRHFRMLPINMFPVCTRRALVNSMGHKHKAKPLIQQNT